MVLEKAKDEKTETYEEMRYKKINDTQYNILNSLNINKTEDDEEFEKNKKEKENDLLNLINTIAINETKVKKEEISEDEDKDLFSDLMGDENTQVYASMKEDVENLSEKLKEADNQIIENKKTIDNSFYTSNLFKEKDLEDDFVEDNHISLVVKILIVVAIAGFLIGVYLFLKSFLGF